MEETRVLKINMLGEFSISYGDETADDQSNRSKKLWSLLEYLITFRDREVRQAEIIEFLWPEDRIDDPANTLKTLLHRVRSLVNGLGLSGCERPDPIQARRLHLEQPVSGGHRYRGIRKAAFKSQGQFRQGGAASSFN